MFDTPTKTSSRPPVPVPAGTLPDWLDIPEPRGFRHKRKFRTVWISDVHLGTRGCNAELLLDFLQSIECRTL
jgi:hypothetical protein